MTTRSRGVSGWRWRDWQFLLLSSTPPSSFPLAFSATSASSDIGQTFSLTEAQTGIMISVYAWGVMLFSLPLMVFASRFDFRRLLLGLIAIFATGQFLSAISPTYLLLICSRLVVATAHAVFWSIVMVVAARVVSPRHASTAMGIVATGSSIAQIFGLPLGRAIGLALGWRMTFAVVGIVAVASLVYLAVVFPPLSAGEKFTLDKLPELFRNGPLVSLYVAIVFLATGQYVAYSYVEPFLSQTVALSAGGVTAALVVIGAAGLLGSWLFSRFYDGHKKGFIAASLVGETVALLALLPAATSLGATVVRDGLLRGSAVDSHQHYREGPGVGGDVDLLWALQPRNWRGVGHWRRYGDAAGCGCRWPCGWSDCRRGNRGYRWRDVHADASEGCAGVAALPDFRLEAVFGENPYVTVLTVRSSDRHDVRELLQRGT